MPFKFNPHQHVKIWLSKDKTSFLNRLNQLRLVRMRDKNPSSTIHFIFDGTLLDVKAIGECLEFCKKHHIIPHDVNKLFSECKSLEERALITLYQDEITHLEEGGNLGSASDKLRLLSPIYSLGTYSDFDVEILTEDLPKEIIVEKPILLHVGSYFPVLQPAHEMLSVNNDTLIVVDPKAALEEIKNIQRIGIILSGKHTIDFLNHPYRDLDPEIPIISKILTKLATAQNARQIRHSVLKLTRTNEHFYRMFMNIASLSPKGESKVGFLADTPQITPKDLSSLAREILENARKMLSYPNISQHFSAGIKKLLENPSEEKTLDFYRNYIKDKLISYTVIESFGPQIYVFGLFNTNLYLRTEMDRKVSPYAIEHYSFAKAFHSKNGYGLHLTQIERDKQLNSAVNDLSWTETGQKKLGSTEQALEDAAIVFQRAWRARNK